MSQPDPDPRPPLNASPPPERLRPLPFLTAFAIVGLFGATATALDRPIKGEDFSKREVQAKYTKAVVAILPEGWAVTRTQTGTTPPDWHTDASKAGFLVEGGNGKHSFSVWFLPPDWIGIRRLPNAAPRTCYWEGILAEDDYLTISACSDETFCDRVHRLFGGGLSTPS